MTPKAYSLEGGDLSSHGLLTLTTCQSGIFMENLFRQSQSCLLRLLNQHRVFTIGVGWAVGAQVSGGISELTN